MKISLFLLVLICLILSCKKEIVETKYLPSQVLSPGQWQLKKLTVETPPGSGIADITAATFDPCELDDIIEFKPGGTFACSENSLVCPLNTGVFYNLNGGSWVLTGDTLLSIMAGFNVQNYKFGKITSNSIELQQTFTNYFGELTRYTFLLNKIKSPVSFETGQLFKGSQMDDQNNRHHSYSIDSSILLPFQLFFSNERLKFS